MKGTTMSDTDHKGLILSALSAFFVLKKQPKPTTENAENTKKTVTRNDNDIETRTDRAWHWGIGFHPLCGLCGLCG
jgi:hypothetical protein